MNIYISFFPEESEQNCCASLKNSMNTVSGKFSRFQTKLNLAEISVHFQGKLFNLTVIQAYASTSNAEEAEVEWFYEDLQDLLELTPKKMSFSL